MLCFEEKKIDSPAKLYVMEVGRDKDAPGGVFRLSPQQIPNAADAPNDFPVAMQASCGRGGGGRGWCHVSITVPVMPRASGDERCVRGVWGYPLLGIVAGVAAMPHG